MTKSDKLNWQVLQISLIILVSILIGVLIGHGIGTHNSQTELEVAREEGFKAAVEAYYRNQRASHPDLGVDDTTTLIFCAGCNVWHCLIDSNWVDSTIKSMYESSLPDSCLDSLKALGEVHLSDVDLILDLDPVSETW